MLPLMSALLRPGPKVVSYSPFLVGFAVLFGLSLLLYPVGVAMTALRGDGAAAVFFAFMGLMTLVMAYAFAKAARTYYATCVRDGARLVVTSRQERFETAVGDARIAVRTVHPFVSGYPPQHEVRLVLSQTTESITLFSSVWRARADRHAEKLVGHLGLPIPPRR